MFATPLPYSVVISLIHDKLKLDSLYLTVLCVEQVLAKPERSSLVYFENRTPFHLTLLPSVSICSEGGWSDPNVWDGQGLSHYTPGETCIRFCET